jgi:hypothetical protein
MRVRAPGWLCLAVLVLLVTACEQPRAEPVIDRLGSAFGRGPAGAFTDRAAISALADQVAAGGPDRRRPNGQLAGKIRAVDAGTAFVYGLGFDGCSQANPRLTVQSRTALVAAVDDLNRQCIQAMPQTAYFAVSWDGLPDRFTIDGPGKAGTVQIHDRTVG